MHFKFKIILLNIIVFFISFFIASYVSSENAKNFLLSLPNIFGILLGGIMASIAIIFGLLSSEELKLMHTLSHEKLNKDVYKNFLNKIKIDTILVFCSLCFSILIKIFIRPEIIFNIDIKLIVLDISIKIYTLLGIGIYLLFLSLSACYDIIDSIFYLQKIRYTLLKNNEDKNKKEEND